MTNVYKSQQNDQKETVQPAKRLPGRPEVTAEERQRRALKTAPWAACFLTYIETGDVTMAAQLHGIDSKAAANKASAEHWGELRDIALQKGTLAATRALERSLGPDAARLEVLHQNREKNFKLAEQMRDDLQELVQGIRDGTLEIEEVKVVKGVVTRYTRRPSIGDRVALVNYASQIAALGYTALGDAPASRSADASTPTARGGGATAPQIQIVLPFAVARPRDEVAPASEERTVIDV